MSTFSCCPNVYTITPNVSMVNPPKVDPKIIAQAVQNVTKMAADTSTVAMDAKFKVAATQKAPQKRRVSTRIMVLDAIRTLNEPTGSALRSIKKYIYAKYEVTNPRRANFHIRAYLRKAFLKGELIQKKRTIFSMSRKFKIAPTKSGK